jgi:hypothetical protein
MKTVGSSGGSLTNEEMDAIIYDLPMPKKCHL